MTDDEDTLVSSPRRADASGYGVAVTLVGAVLLAFAYYGVLALQRSRELGEAIPEPFYLLAIAVLFALELLRAGGLTVGSLARSLAFTAVFGALFVFAVEGGAYLWAHPAVALEGYAGATVLAAAVVIAALCYVVVLAALEGRR